MLLTVVVLLRLCISELCTTYEIFPPGIETESAYDSRETDLDELGVIRGVLFINWKETCDLYAASIILSGFDESTELRAVVYDVGSYEQEIGDLATVDEFAATGNGRQLITSTFENPYRMYESENYMVCWYKSDESFLRFPYTEIGVDFESSLSSETKGSYVEISWTPNDFYPPSWIDVRFPFIELECGQPGCTTRNRSERVLVPVPTTGGGLPFQWWVIALAVSGAIVLYLLYKKLCVSKRPTNQGYSKQNDSDTGYKNSRFTGGHTPTGARDTFTAMPSRNTAPLPTGSNVPLPSINVPLPPGAPTQRRNTFKREVNEYAGSSSEETKDRKLKTPSKPRNKPKIPWCPPLDWSTIPFEEVTLWKLVLAKPKKEFTKLAEFGIPLVEGDNRYFVPQNEFNKWVGENAKIVITADRRISFRRVKIKVLGNLKGHNQKKCVEKILEAFTGESLIGRCIGHLEFMVPVSLTPPELQHKYIQLGQVLKGYQEHLGPNKEKIRPVGLTRVSSRKNNFGFCRTHYEIAIPKWVAEAILESHQCVRPISDFVREKDYSHDDLMLLTEILITIFKTYDYNRLESSITVARDEGLHNFVLFAEGHVESVRAADAKIRKRKRTVEICLGFDRKPNDPKPTFSLSACKAEIEMLAKWGIETNRLTDKLYKIQRLQSALLKVKKLSRAEELLAQAESKDFKLDCLKENIHKAAMFVKSAMGIDQKLREAVEKKDVGYLLKNLTLAEEIGLPCVNDITILLESVAACEVAMKKAIQSKNIENIRNAIKEAIYIGVKKADKPGNSGGGLIKKARLKIEEFEKLNDNLLKAYEARDVDQIRLNINNARQWELPALPRCQEVLKEVKNLENRIHKICLKESYSLETLKSLVEQSKEYKTIDISGAVKKINAAEDLLTRFDIAEKGGLWKLAELRALCPKVEMLGIDCEVTKKKTEKYVTVFQEKWDIAINECKFIAIEKFMPVARELNKSGDEPQLNITSAQALLDIRDEKSRILNDAIQQRNSTLLTEKFLKTVEKMGISTDTARAFLLKSEDRIDEQCIPSKNDVFKTAIESHFKVSLSARDMQRAIILFKTGKHFGLKLKKKDEIMITKYKKCRLEVYRAFQKLDFDAILKLRKDMYSYGMERELDLLNWIEENSEVKPSSLKYKWKFAIAFRDVKALKALQQLELVDWEGPEEKSEAIKILREVEKVERSIQEHNDPAKIEGILIKAETKFYNFESIQNISNTIEQLDMQIFAMEVLAEPSLPQEVLEDISEIRLESKKTSDRNHAEWKALAKNSDMYNNSSKVKLSIIPVTRIDKVTDTSEIFPESKVQRSNSPTQPSNRNQSIDEKFIEQSTPVEEKFPEPVTDSDSIDQEPREVKDAVSSAYLGKWQITSPTASSDSQGHLPMEKICYSISPMETPGDVSVHRPKNRIADEEKAYKKPRKREERINQRLLPKLDSIQSA